MYLRDERTDTGAHQRGPAPRAEHGEDRDGDVASGIPASPRGGQAGLPRRRADGRRDLPEPAGDGKICLNEE